MRRADGRALDQLRGALLLEPVEPVVAAAAIDLGDVDDGDGDVVGRLEDAAGCSARRSSCAVVAGEAPWSR